MSCGTSPASGRIRLDRQTVDLNQVIRHAVETAMPAIEQRKHTLAVELSSGPLWCDVDATRIEEVFVNLLNNAAKYTPDGGCIEVYCEHPDGEGIVQVRVRDTGSGIDRELLPHIFDLFTQADKSLARSAGGLGIGLSLARQLVHLHGGTIKAFSPPEGHTAGSEFVVRMAISAAPPQITEHECKPEEPKKCDGLRVLVVDDNIDSATMLATVLRQLGHSVQTAYTGPSGLNVALQWRPDVVLLDIGLPELDGYEVAKRLRSDPALQKMEEPMRIFALTGYGRDTDVSQAQEAGFDAHMVKPIDLEKLESLMAVRQPAAA